MKKHLLLLTLLGALFVFPSEALAQRQSPTMKKRLNELEDKKEQNARQEAADMEALRKKHMSNQSKEVRKRMKRNMRAANRRAAGKPAKRGSAFRGLFKKKGF